MGIRKADVCAMLHTLRRNQSRMWGHLKGSPVLHRNPLTQDGSLTGAKGLNTTSDQHQLNNKLLTQGHFPEVRLRNNIMLMPGSLEGGVHG